MLSRQGVIARSFLIQLASPATFLFPLSSRRYLRAGRNHSLPRIRFAGLSGAFRLPIGSGAIP